MSTHALLLKFHGQGHKRHDATWSARTIQESSHSEKQNYYNNVNCVNKKNVKSITVSLEEWAHRIQRLRTSIEERAKVHSQ